MVGTSLLSQKPTFGASPRGINIGDIVAEDEDIYGDGVIVVARVEGLAEQGGRPMFKL